MSSVDAQVRPHGTYALTVSGKPTFAAGGTIKVGSQTAQCSLRKCSATFQVDPGKVKVEFTPNDYSTIGGFSLDGKVYGTVGSGGSKFFEFNIDKPTAVTFGVSPKQFKVSVAKVPDKNITIIYYQNNFVKKENVNSCSGSGVGKPCTFLWDAGRPLLMDSHPSWEYELDEWFGSCVGKSPCAVKVMGDEFLGYTVKARKYTLSLSVVGNAQGKVYSNPPGINCSSVSGPCKMIANAGTFITLILDPGSSGVEGVFGDQMCVGQKTPNKCILQMGGDIDWTIVFKNK